MQHLRITLALASLASLTAAHAVTLPNVDCAKDKQNARCKLVRSTDAGSMGDGPTIQQGGFDKIVSAYIDANKNVLYVAAELGGNTDTFGAIFSVDLKTGNRSLISGILPSGDRRGKGVRYTSDHGHTNEAYDLGDVKKILPLQDGRIAAWVQSRQQRMELLAIDPNSGDRSLLWASTFANDSNKNGLRALEGDPEGSIGKQRCVSVDAKDGRVATPGWTIETDGQGNFYAPAINNPVGTGLGLLKITPGRGCAWVSGYFEDGQNLVGDGSMILTRSPIMLKSAFKDGKYYGVTGPNPSGNTLFAIDVQSGERQTISLNARVSAQSKGKGDAAVGYLGGFAAGPDGFLTAQASTNDDYFAPVLVRWNGDRQRLAATSGPLKSNINDVNWNVLANVPGTPQFIVSFNTVLFVFDAATGNSYLLSF